MLLCTECRMVHARVSMSELGLPRELCGAVILCGSAAADCACNAAARVQLFASAVAMVCWLTVILWDGMVLLHC